MELEKTLAALKNPTFTQINAVRVLFEQIAYLNMVKGIIVPIKEKVLKMIKAVDRRNGEPVTEHTGVRRLSEKQWEEYKEEYHWELSKERMFNRPMYIKKEGAICPLREAEDLLRQAEKAVILAMSDITGIKLEDIQLCPDEWKEHIDNTLKYFAPFFFVRDNRAVYIGQETQVANPFPVYLRGIYKGIDLAKNGMSVSVYTESMGVFHCYFQDGSVLTADANWVRCFIEAV